MPSSSYFDVDHEGYPIDKRRDFKRTKILRALEFPPVSQPEVHIPNIENFGPFENPDVSAPATTLKREGPTGGIRLYKKTRVNSHASNDDLHTFQQAEQGVAPALPFFGDRRNRESSQPKAGVKRKAATQKTPKPKVSYKYLRDNPIAAINRLRAARRFETDLTLDCDPANDPIVACAVAVESVQRNSQAGQAQQKDDEPQHLQQQQQQQQQEPSHIRA